MRFSLYCQYAVLNKNHPENVKPDREKNVCVSVANNNNNKNRINNRNQLNGIICGGCQSGINAANSAWHCYE